VASTEAGAPLVERLSYAFAEVEEALDQVRTDQGRVARLLRLNVARVALLIAVTPILAELALRHPGLVVAITNDDALTDIVQGGFDAGVRLGEMIAQDMVAVQPTPPFQSITVASPACLAARETPASIPDLRERNCISFKLLGR
jgi:DNA-binding transcriptional LysR family regulator